MKIAKLPSNITALLLLAASAHAASTAATDTQTLYLSGHNKDDAIPWSFSCNAGQQANVQSTIPVPSNWELHNFGIFSYGVEHRGSKSKPAVPLTPVTGHYQTHFTTPATFAGHRVFLVFDGSMTDTTASINGKQAGDMHQGGYTRFKYDVTDLLHAGDNMLDVTVTDESANDSVNQAERRADYFNYAGIYRPVYLEAVPQQFIERVAINAQADGKFTATAEGHFPAESMNDHYQLQSDLLDADGKIVNTTLIPVEDVRIAGNIAQWSANPATSLDHPKLWTAETPNLYTLQLALKNGDKVIHTISQRFGFRTIDPRPDGLYVNGARVLLKGADRHSFWPDSGRCLSEKISHDDIALMHEMNMNAVRMSHYPPDAHFLDAADEMGIYVLDELPGWHGKYDDEVGHKIVREMLTRDVNHPSIIFWDNGNEGGFNTHLDPDYAALDPQKRRVLYPWTLHDGVDTKHYPDFKTLTQKVNGPNLYFPTEFLHGLYDGGAGAGLEDYWNEIMHGKAAAGGIIWALVDEAPKRVDTDGHLDTRGNMAPDGIVGPYREKEGSFYAIKQLWSPVVITDKELPKDGQLHVENRYSFINLQDCKFTYQLRKFPTVADGKAGFTVLKEGTLASPNVPAGASGNLALDPALVSDHEGSVLAIRIESPAGQELFTPVFHVLNYAESGVIRAAGLTHIGEAKITRAPDSQTITTGAFALTLGKNGSIVKITNGDKSCSLTNGPRLVIGDSTLQGAQSLASDRGVSLTFRFTGDLRSLKYFLYGNGWIDITAEYHLTGPQPFVGLGFDYPEKNIKSLRYLGDGPFRVYANRTAGPTLSVWQNDYNDSITGAIPWKYPEFKGYFQNVRWAQYQTTEGPLTFLIHDDHTYLQNFTPTEPDKSLVGKTHVPYPTTNIAFLKMIPAIGSKFSTPESTGPAAQTQPAAGDYTTHLSLYFGELSNVGGPPGP